MKKNSEYYTPNKIYTHKSILYTCKFIGYQGNKPTYEIVTTNEISGFKVGDKFTPNDPEKWFDITDTFIPPTPVKETEPEQPYYKGKGEHSVNQLEAICSQYKEYVSFLNSRGNDTTPTSKEGLTYKVECLDNSTAHYTHDKKEAYEVYAKFIIDFGDTIRLHEAPMPINDHDEIDWETIECYDVDENESKEGLEDGGFTPGEWEASYNSEEFPGQAAIYGCDGDTNGRVIAVLDTSDQTDMANIDLICAAPIMYDLLKWVVNEIETTPDELSDALLGMIKIKCNQLFTRINKD